MMQELFAQPYFGVLLTIAAYWAGMKIQHKTRLAICNGMLLAVLLVIAVLLVFHIPYESYYQGGALINLFLGPATACMAVTIYSQRRLLAKHWLPVLVGCTVGVVTAMGSILLLCRLFGLDRAMAMSLLPKSVTMPIATVVSQGHGGTMAITVAAVVVTGMLGNLCAPLLVKLFRVKDPMAVGLGIGACSHAMGTAKALELGETEGAMSGLAIGLCGDLKFGRTVHSLIKTMARCENIRFVLISPEELRVPDYIITDVLEANHIPYKETRSLEESMPELDILYMTRVQKERFFNEEDYVRLKNSYILTKEKMALAKPDMAVLHPLPRVNEITLDVDDDPRAAYFEQVQNAVYIRMALIMTLLGLKDPKAEKEGN